MKRCDEAGCCVRWQAHLFLGHKRPFRHSLSAELYLLENTTTPSPSHVVKSTHCHNEIMAASTSATTYAHRSLAREMASTVQVNDPNDYFRLFDLPQELQDRIFGYAYAKSKDVKIVKRGSREHKVVATKLELSREATIDVLSEYHVDEWLICKKWFVGAAKAYVSNSLIKFHVARATSVVGSRHVRRQSMPIERRSRS